jgi:hypothetical protein
MLCQRRLSCSLRCVVTGVSLCVLLVSLGALLVGCQGASTPGAAATSTPAKGSGNLPGDGDPQIYWDTIKQQVAQGLHRSVADLTALWGPPPGGSGQKGGNPLAVMTISDVATQEGLTRDQLTTLELNAIQAACTQLVHQGALTQAQADARMQEIRGWSLSNLDGYTMYAFSNH